MGPFETGGTVLVAALLMIFLRVPVGLSLGLAAFGGAFALLPATAAISLMSRVPYEFTASWEFAAVPLFLAMGTIITRSGMADGLIILAERSLRRLPGGLAIATNFAGAGFGAASGSSLATTVALGRMAIPQMLRAGYDPGLATATTACAGTLAALIPPSIPLIVYGILAEVSVAKLFFAGIVPGLLTAFAYGAMIYLRCRFNPDLAPRSETATDETVGWSVATFPVIAIVILGGIYGGYFSPSEAGAVGALAAIALAFFQPGFNWRELALALAEAARQTAAILFVAAGAFMLTRTMALTGLPNALADLVQTWSVSPLLLILASSVLFLLLGMVLDPFGVMLLSVAVLLPAFERLGFDLIWMGIIIVKFIEIGLVTPPVGLNVFAAKSVAPPEIGLTVIFRGVSWFLLAEAFVMAILFLFPALTLWLPNNLL
ncbi:TRAP transporter large permease subunit [Hoeflea sp. WL0058]|uniref:TRAP transporter large permease protein n=1 Tax=Flavimaribacter sediminis TaxID=2865987 RepID=A0AAE2ZSX9_9HYPH|nr:TRAP transporter large permease subunit [Flavimaribacter sediminis]MBW8640260.1 TRAP transporter large permease subunit [Flavimaribacter sediminis]